MLLVKIVHIRIQRRLKGNIAESRNADTKNNEIAASLFEFFDMFHDVANDLCVRREQAVARRCNLRVSLIPFNFLHNEWYKQLDFLSEIIPLLVGNTILVDDDIVHHIPVVKLDLRFRHSLFPFVTFVGLSVGGWLIFAFFYRCRGTEEILRAFGVEIGLAVVGVNAIDFLLDIGELCIAITGDIRMIGQYKGQFADQRLDLFRRLTVSPFAPSGGVWFLTFVLFRPEHADVLVHGIRLALVGYGNLREANEDVFTRRAQPCLAAEEFIFEDSCEPCSRTIGLTLSVSVLR